VRKIHGLSLRLWLLGSAFICMSDPGALLAAEHKCTRTSGA
jgi:hypothetical protein